MKPMLDLLPIGVFVGAYFITHDFFAATIALMIATAAQVALTWLFTRAVGQQLWVTFWLVMVLGGLTVALHDKTFLVWKPTLVNWAFAAAVLIGQAFGKSPLKMMLGSQLTLPDAAWRHLGYGWSAGFVLAGALNLWVAANFSESFWVGYKLWGGFGLTLLYIVATGIYLSANDLLAEPPDERNNAADSVQTPGDVPGTGATPGATLGKAARTDLADGNSPY